nr:MAG: putative RNA-dependent RNA polymerase [Marnaviridae sp.]
MAQYRFFDTNCANPSCNALGVLCRNCAAWDGNPFNDDKRLIFAVQSDQAELLALRVVDQRRMTEKRITRQMAKVNKPKPKDSEWRVHTHDLFMQRVFRPRRYTNSRIAKRSRNVSAPMEVQTRKLTGWERERALNRRLTELNTPQPPPPPPAPEMPYFPAVPVPLKQQFRDAIGKFLSFSHGGNGRARSLLGKYVALSQMDDLLADHLETTWIFMYGMLTAKSYCGRMLAIATLAKILRTKLNVTYITAATIQTIVEHFLSKKSKKGKMKVQSWDFLNLDGIESGLEFYSRLKESPIYNKMYKLLMYILSMSVFSELGLTFDLLKFEPCAQAAIKAKYHMGPDFVVTMLDTLVFMCKRGYQCYQTGTILPLFHSTEKYQEWYDTAERLNRQSQFLSNGEALGIDKFAFLADLKQAIEEGRSIKKYVVGKNDAQMVAKLLSKLEYNYDMEVTKRASQKARAAPYAILVHGGSSVGKTSFVEIMFKHYGKVRNLRTSSDHKYTRNPGADFWDGYDTSKWCVVLDDIAYMNPALGVMDPSLQELLWIVNNTPYVPNQAALEDKGRTPLMCEFVMGTTNTQNLNTTAYFSCPLAVQRRFPYVLNIKPKREFQDRDRPGMLASHLRPDTISDTYDDLWDITLYRVVPVNGPGPVEMARNELVTTFTRMADFLKWFNLQIHEHQRIQAIVKESLDNAEDVLLCTDCELPVGFCDCGQEYVSCLRCEELQITCHCSEVQAGEICDTCQLSAPFCECEHVEEEVNTEPAWMDENLDDALLDVDPVEYPSFLESCEMDVRLVVQYYGFLYKYVYSTWYLNAVMESFAGRNWFWRQVYRSNYKGKVVRALFGYMGERAQSAIGYPAILVGAASAIALAYGTYKAGKSLLTRVMEPQGANMSSGSTPAPDATHIKSQDYTHPFAVNQDDYSQTVLCSKGQDPEVLKRYVGRATVAVRVMQGEHVKHSTMVNVRGNVYMLNCHAIFEHAPFSMEIIDEVSSLNRGIAHTLVTENMLYRVPDRDLVFVKLAIRPPGSDITAWFCRESYQGLVNGYYHGRHISGNLWSEPVRAIKLEKATWRSLDRAVCTDVWKGKVNVPTSVGDCGTCLVANTAAGHMILGVHVLGLDNEIGAIKVTQELVTEACDTLEPNYFNRGSIPLSAPSQERKLGPIHPQSATHKVVGFGDIKGSYLGFRTMPKTNVGPTYIAEAVAKRGYVTDKVAPIMGKAPWIAALKDMTRPVTMMRNDILEQATEMFKDETRCAIPDVMVYSLHVAINGSPGVRFCDKLNRKTSAGCPYKCPKTRFMFALDDGTTDYGIVPEIEDEMERIVSCYHRRERAHPIYCGHQKDEPISQEKALNGKVRIFTASSMAHTLVVRKYLLSVIVHMQKRRYQYETGPGTIVQSLEWEEIYRYLTVFGTDRIVAGDYSKFDKRMPAPVIMAAFDVVHDICARAGYSEQDLLVVRGIAYDTAYPLVDFNGDLIEFYGSNPSGHPLTVIVNGLANALYMRYCYIILRPINVGFKKNVKLMTYGDDNIMGVSRSADWFNHTAIQAVLADIDIGYTMADKEAVSQPFIDISASNFLKRTWRFDLDLGHWVAPLDLSSISKMLLVYVIKGNISPEAHAIEVLNTAIREYFWYGKVKFAEKSKEFNEIVLECGLQDYLIGNEFPSWEELTTQFEQNSQHVDTSRW